MIALAHAPLAAVSVHIGRSLDGTRRTGTASPWPCTAPACACTCGGHEHLYAHRLIRLPGLEPIHQLTIGGGGATGYDVMTPDVVHAVSASHAGLIDVAGRTGWVRVLDTKGQEIDACASSTDPSRGPRARWSPDVAAGAHPRVFRSCL